MYWPRSLASKGWVSSCWLHPSRDQAVRPNLCHRTISIIIVAMQYNIIIITSTTEFVSGEFVDQIAGGILTQWTSGLRAGDRKLMWQETTTETWTGDSLDLLGWGEAFRNAIVDSWWAGGLVGWWAGERYKTNDVKSYRTGQAQRFGDELFFSTTATPGVHCVKIRLSKAAADSTAA